MENRDFNQQENMNQEMNPGGQHVDRQGSGKNRFWSGVLAGALVTAFVG